jgi:hypothetical protein
LMMIMTMTVTNKELSSFVAVHTSETMKSPLLQCYYDLFWTDTDCKLYIYIYAMLPY